MHHKPDWKIQLANWLNGFGIDVFKLRRGIKGFPAAMTEYQLFNSQQGNDSQFPLQFNYRCPADRFEEGGVASGHYFHQDLFVAQKIFARNPDRHLDVGSRIDGFVSHIASFRKIEILELRQITKNVRNIIFHEFDLMSPVTDFESCCDSLSCLHTLEHLGLGRYGDRIMVNGHELGFQSLWTILRPRGILYLSVPIGTQRVEFNAHRVFSIQTILEMAKNKFELSGFSYVDDLGDIHINTPLTEEAIERSFNCWYGCGIFEFRKIDTQSVK